MADSDNSDVSALLAPWLSSNPWDPSTYGGQGAMGAAFLSAAGPTPYRQNFLSALGKGMQMGQANALNMAQQRMGVVGNSIAMQRQLAMLPYQLSYLRMLQQQATGGGSQPAPTSDSGSAPSQDSASSGSQDAAPLTGPPGNLVSQYPFAPWMDSSSSGSAPPPAGASTQSPASASSAPLPDPFGSMRLAAFGGAMGMPGAQQLTELGKAQLEYNPGAAFNKSDIAQDLYARNAALRAGNIPLYRMLDNKLQQDVGALQIARNSGIRQELLPNGQWAMFNPENMTYGVGNSIAPIPGAVQAKEALAGAQARGTAQGELTEVVDPRTKQSYFVPKSALLGGGGAAAPGVGVTPGAGSPGVGATDGGAPLAALSPQQAGQLRESGVEGGKYLGTLQSGADAAVTANYAIDQMIADARSAQLGPGAPARAFGERMMAGLAQQFGFNPPKELASYEALDKYGNQLGMAQARALGSREAAQIVQLAIKSNPNKELVPDAFANIAQSMRAMNSYVIAKNAALQAWSANGSALQASSVWTQKVDPRVWDLTLGPQLAALHAPTLGVPKIATAIPLMSSEDAVSVIRNLSPTMRPLVLAKLPQQAKQEILAAMQDAAATNRGAGGSW